LKNDRFYNIQSILIIIHLLQGS